MRSNVNIFLALLFVTLGGCASTSGVKLTAKHDLSIQSWSEKGDRSTVQLHQGETATLTESMNEITAPNRHALTVILPNQSSSSLAAIPWEVNLKPVDEWRGKQTEDFLNREIDQLYLTLLSVLDKLREKKKTEALTLISEVTAKHPKLASAHYVKAQVQVVDGDIPGALRTITTALELRPGFTEALNLKKKLEAQGSP